MNPVEACGVLLYACTSSGRYVGHLGFSDGDRDRRSPIMERSQGVARDMGGGTGASDSDPLPVLDFPGDGFKAGGWLSGGTDAGTEDIHPQQNRQLLFAGLHIWLCGVFGDEDRDIWAVDTKYCDAHQINARVRHLHTVNCTQFDVAVLTVQVPEMLRSPGLCNGGDLTACVNKGGHRYALN